MAFHKTIGAAAVTLGVLGGSTAWADVSAGQVWDDFRSYLETFGYTVSADETDGADALVVSDITLTMDIPEDGGTATFGLPDLTFTDAGDGTVEVTVPAESRMPFAVDATDDDDASGELVLAQTGFLMTVSGAPGDMVYGYTAADLRMSLANLTVEGEPQDIAAASMALRDIDGESTVKVDDLRNVAQTMTASAMEYEVDMADPEAGDGRVVVRGQLTDLGFDGGVSLPLEPLNTDNPNALIEAGFDVTSAFTHSGGQTEFNIEDDETTVSGTTNSDSGRFGVRMNAERLGYDVAADGLALNMTSDDLPFPVEAEMEETALTFQLPVTPGDAPQDFALGLTLGGFTMSDMIWGMFDPAGQLPRDPATLAVDLTGKAKLDVPLLDAEAMESDEAPGELRALTIADLVLRLAGAELTGQGDFTFDNSDTSSFDGMPRPEGALNLRLEGGNTLLDTLVNMGLLPEEQATGARMMMGVFAVPGEGEDVMTSTIEVNEAGQVLANGQRVR
jgi:hypothetical protein